MTERELAHSIEIVADRIYWVALQTRPTETAKSHYFTIDNEFIYEPFFQDFGPLNMCMVYRYCKKMEKKLVQFPGKRIIHYCSHDSKKRSNAIFLICAFQVIVNHKAPEEAFLPFMDAFPPILPFRDALRTPPTFHLTIWIA